MGAVLHPERCTCDTAETATTHVLASEGLGLDRRAELPADESLDQLHHSSVTHLTVAPVASFHFSQNANIPQHVNLIHKDE